MCLSDETRASMRSAIQVARTRASDYGPLHETWDVIRDAESILARRQPMIDWDIDELIDELNGD